MSDSSLNSPVLDLKEIHSLKARYCRFVDTKQWIHLAGLFAADARVEGFAAVPKGSSAADFVSALSKRMATSITVHQCFMPEIRFLGGNEARGIWAMEDYVDFLPGNVVPEMPEARGFRGHGHYEEVYRREDDGVWRFSFMRLTRLRLDPVLPTEPAPRPGLLSASDDWLGG